MIKREIENTVLRLSGQFPVIAVTGPRQSGKSTLVKKVFPDKRYVSFDERDMRELARSNPMDFLLAFPDGLIIDEAQKVPEIFDAVKYYADMHPYDFGKYILTGSSQFRLKENIESLSGRIGLVHLLPFSIKELNDNGLLKENPYDMAFSGFYPPFFDERRSLYREDWFDNYLDTYLDIDVRDQIRDSNIATFKKFIQICALYSGQMLNMDSIAKAIGISAVTVKSWLSVLQASYIIFFLEQDTNSLGKNLVKSPKLYFTDTGLLCYLLRIDNYQELILSGYKGAVVETMAVSELLKQRYNKGRKANLTYFRDRNGFEVDTIADWKKTFAIEVKSDSFSDNKPAKNVRKYAELRGENTKAMVFYLGDTTIRTDSVDYISWKEWGNIADQES